MWGPSLGKDKEGFLEEASWALPDEQSEQDGYVFFPLHLVESCLTQTLALGSLP